MASFGHFRVLYFASAFTMTEREWDDFPAPMSLDDLFRSLEKLYPGIHDRILLTSAVTKNLEYVETQQDEGALSSGGRTLFNQGDEVAIIPPVSSG